MPAGIGAMEGEMYVYRKSKGSALHTNLAT